MKNKLIAVFNFRCIVVVTLFLLGNIHQNLIAYLFIHGLFYKYHVIVNLHPMKYCLLFLKTFYFAYRLLKIDLNIHNLCQFHWYTLTLLFSHLWILLIHFYNFIHIILSLLQPYYLGMYVVILYLRIFTYHII